MLQHVGILSVFLVIVLGVWLMMKWPMHKGISFSENIARNRSSILAFGAGMTLVTILYYWFLLAWLGPHLSAPPIYYWLVILAGILQLILSWVPASHGRSMLIHAVAAYGVGLVMAATAAALLAIASLGALHAGLLIIFLVYTALVYFLVLFVPKSKQYFLYFQLVFFALFWAVIVALTYL